MDPDQQVLTVTSLLHVCMCACKQLSGNHSFDRGISAHEKGGSVRKGRVMGPDWKLLKSLLHYLTMHLMPFS